MSRTMSCHHELTEGVGRCSVPMWSMGCPAGFCDELAYGKRPSSSGWRFPSGEFFRDDGKYAGYVPGLACSSHGGPKLSEVAHKGDPCDKCGIPHDEVEAGPCK